MIRVTTFATGMVILFSVVGATRHANAASGKVCFHESESGLEVVSSGTDCSCEPYTEKEYVSGDPGYTSLQDLSSPFDSVMYFRCSTSAPIVWDADRQASSEQNSLSNQTNAQESRATGRVETTETRQEMVGGIDQSATTAVKNDSAYHDFLNHLAKPSQERSDFPELDLSRNPFVNKFGQQQEVKACMQENTGVIQDINTQIARLHNSVPSWGEGHQVEVGSCASRLRKLSGNMLCCKTYATFAPIWEEISCLELKKFYLRKSCECRRVGGFSTDEALQDGIIEKYAGLQLLRRKALKEGVGNPAIRAYISDANELLDCFNEKTLGVLNSIESRLGYEINLR